MSILAKSNDKINEVRVCVDFLIIRFSTLKPMLYKEIRGSIKNHIKTLPTKRKKQLEALTFYTWGYDLTGNRDKLNPCYDHALRINNPATLSSLKLFLSPLFSIVSGGSEGFNVVQLERTVDFYLKTADILERGMFAAQLYNNWYSVHQNKHRIYRSPKPRLSKNGLIESGGFSLCAEQDGIFSKKNRRTHFTFIDPNNISDNPVELFQTRDLAISLVRTDGFSLGIGDHKQYDFNKSNRLLSKDDAYRLYYKTTDIRTGDEEDEITPLPPSEHRVRTEVTSVLNCGLNELHSVLEPMDKQFSFVRVAERFMKKVAPNPYVNISGILGIVHQKFIRRLDFDVPVYKDINGHKRSTNPLFTLDTALNQIIGDKLKGNCKSWKATAATTTALTVTTPSATDEANDAEIAALLAMLDEPIDYASPTITAEEQQKQAERAWMERQYKIDNAQREGNVQAMSEMLDSHFLD